MVYVKPKDFTSMIKIKKQQTQGSEELCFTKMI